MMRFLILAAGLSAAVSTTAPTEAQSNPFIGEVTPSLFSYCPRNWLPADGRLLPIASNSALFSLYGTMYGGDGRSTFGLPNLIARMPVGQGQGQQSTFVQGGMYGTNEVLLTASNLPAHNHTFNGSSDGGSSATPAGATASTYPPGTPVYAPANGLSPTLNPNSVGSTGGSVPYQTRQPQIGVFYCVATQGVYPQRP
jgi:microcystin-dependent protein